MLSRETMEHVIRNDGVGGSNPSCGTNKIKELELKIMGLDQACLAEIATK
jgi:hypothetical protein